MYISIFITTVELPRKKFGTSSEQAFPRSITFAPAEGEKIILTAAEVELGVNLNSS